jgi:hypothetical protein
VRDLAPTIASPELRTMIPRRHFVGGSATDGRADVLLCTTCPSVDRWDTMAELSTACRQAAAAKNAGPADIGGAFRAAGKTVRDR